LAFIKIKAFHILKSEAKAATIQQFKSSTLFAIVTGMLDAVCAIQPVSKASTNRQIEFVLKRNGKVGGKIREGNERI